MTFKEKKKNHKCRLEPLFGTDVDEFLFVDWRLVNENR